MITKINFAVIMHEQHSQKEQRIENIVKNMKVFRRGAHT